MTTSRALSLLRSGWPFRPDSPKHSAERITDADADHIFVWVYGNTEEIESAAEQALDQLRANPLWDRLVAVQAGNVYVVGDHWIGGGPRAANAILDDLEQHLT